MKPASPWFLTPAERERTLIDRFFLTRFAEDFRTIAAEGGAHLALLTGPSGAGRSHLLATLADTLSADFTVRVFDEYTQVGGWDDVWARWARPMRTDSESVALDSLEMGFRPVLIVVDRLDQLLDALGTLGASRFRAVLQERRWSVLGGARVEGPAFTDRESPFFRSFATHAIPEHSAEAIFRWKHGWTPKDIQAAWWALGGRPGAWTHFSGENWRMALAHAAKIHGPLLRARMESLSAGQRASFAAALACGRPMAVGALAGRAGQPAKLTSTNLRRLEAEGWMSSLPAGRERYYEVADPLDRLAVSPPDDDRLDLWSAAAGFREHGAGALAWEAAVAAAAGKPAVIPEGPLGDVARAILGVPDTLKARARLSQADRRIADALEAGGEP